MEFSFAHPSYLFLLVIIPLIVFIHFISLRHKGGHALRFANFEAISRIRGIDLYSKNISILILTILVCICLIFSVSGFTVHRTMSASAFSFVIAIDSSTSMEADDMVPDRITAAKNTALEFVDSAPIGTYFGVVSFSGNALIEQGMTQEKSLVKNAIDNIGVSLISGTDLYEGVVTSTNLLVAEEAGAVIILSDGQINVGDLDDAINYVNINNVLVHSIAIGTLEGGKTSYGLSKVDEDSLKTVAFNTNGKFFRATNTEELSASFNEVLEYEIRNVSFNLSSYLVTVAILLFVLEYLLINTRYRIFP
ncbi:MAG: VWA domain-containing protein [Nanoarchaeota archaeon]